MVLHEGGIIRLFCIVLSNWATEVFFCGVATVLVLHWASFQHQESKSIQVRHKFPCKKEDQLHIKASFQVLVTYDIDQLNYSYLDLESIK